MCVSKSSLASARMNAPPFSTVAVAARSFVESSAVHKKKHKSRQCNRRYGVYKKKRTELAEVFARDDEFQHLVPGLVRAARAAHAYLPVNKTRRQSNCPYDN